MGNDREFFETENNWEMTDALIKLNGIIVYYACREGNRRFLSSAMFAERVFLRVLVEICNLEIVSNS